MARQRKSAQIINNQILSNVEPLAINDLVFTDQDNHKFYFVRLKYKHVPPLSAIVEQKTGLVDANRDDVIRKLYTALNQDNGVVSITTISHLKLGLLHYFKFVDKTHEQQVLFSLESMNEFITILNAQALRGVHTSLPAACRGALIYCLKAMGHTDIARKLKTARFSEGLGKQTALNVEAELKPLSKILIKGFMEFSQHIANNTLPILHPFFDQEVFDQMAKISNWDKNKKRHTKRSFSNAFVISPEMRKNSNAPLALLNQVAMFNQASRCALFLFFLLTGMNATPLYKLKRKDVVFKEIGAGKYVFNGVKGRAGYKVVDNSLGFSAKTKTLILDWLATSRIIYNALNINELDDLPLFPFINSTLAVSDFATVGAHPLRINNLIGKLLPIRINPTRLRKTKSDLLMRVTEDMYIVAQGLNNTVSVAAKTYTAGLESDHQRNLNAAMVAQASIAKGKSIRESVENAKILNADILSDYDYKERLKRNELLGSTLTPTGVHCAGDTNVLNQIKRKIKNLDIKLPESEQKCTNFLACFDCDNHFLVATTNDIWLMLSFFETLRNVENLPSQNSIPDQKLSEIKFILEKTLARLKNKAESAYNEAVARLDNKGLHPLYDSTRALSDNLEVFNV